MRYHSDSQPITPEPAGLGAGPLRSCAQRGVWRMGIAGALGLHRWLWRLPTGVARQVGGADFDIWPLALLGAWRSPERYFELLPLAAILALVLTLRTGNGTVAGTEALSSSHQAPSSCGKEGSA